MKQELNIQTIQDIRGFLKSFGTFIYTGDPLADLELMEEECRELFEFNVMESLDFQMAILLIKQEKRKYV
jgi:uncharacterized protein YqgQ